MASNNTQKEYLYLLDRFAIFSRMTGNELKLERKRLKISQQTLAVSLDLALSTVARWEQLKDEDIPNSTILELALKGLKAQSNTKKAA
jgi:DNA-binding transcriptional regulator YiaG